MSTHTRGHTVATLYEAAGIDCALNASIKPAWVGAQAAGPAYTIVGKGGDNLALHLAVDRAPEGSILVADLDGASCGHWGEVLGLAAQVRGLAGLVIDGGVRDTLELAHMGFPVFSASVCVMRTTKRFPGVLGESAQVGGVNIATGDLVVADPDGVIALPSQEVEEILDRADARIAFENDAMERLRAGESTVSIYGFESERS